MKKSIFAVGVVGMMMLASSLAFALNERSDMNFSGDINMDGSFALKSVKITATGTELNIMDGVTATVAQINQIANNTFTSLTNSGKSTLNGELEVNGAAGATLDINMVTNANLITIDQTAIAGTASTPLININDDRIGDTANEATEATLVIDADGVYAVYISDGILSIADEIDAAGDITIDPAGNDLIVDATVDATAYTSDAGSGIDVKSAGALDIGNTTATSIDYGSSAVTAHTLTADGTGDSKVVLPLLSIGNGEINDVAASKVSGTLGVDHGGSGAATFTDNGVLIGNAASAFSVTAVGVDGQVLLGATGANPTWGTMGTDASISAAGAVTVSKGLAMTNGASLVNIPVAAVNGEALVKTTTFTGGGVTGTWATLTVDSLPAISGANLTGLVAANITAAGTLPQLDASALTAINGANIASGDIAAARMTAFAALKTEVYGESTITGDAGAAAQLLMTNVIQTVAADGSTPITDYAITHVWVSETDMGAASTNNIEALTLSGGTAVATVTANGDYWYVTSSAGAETVVIEGTASSLTNYLMIAVGPQINSKAIVFTTP